MKNTIEKHIGCFRGTLTLILSAMMLVSCGDSNVDLVKNGTMESHPQGAIGKVFEANFDNPQWSSKEKGGKVYVTFNGEISPSLHSHVASNKVYVKGVYYHNRREIVDSLEEEFREDYEKNVVSLRNAYSEYKKQSDDERKLIKIRSELTEKLRSMRSFSPTSWLKSQLKGSEESILKYKDLAAKETGSKKEFYLNQLRQVQARSIPLSKKIAKIEAENKVIEQERAALEKEIKPKLEKIDAWFAQKRKKLDQMHKELGEATIAFDARKKEAHQKIIDNLPESLWPTKSKVHFTWLVYADRETFELSEFGNDSWSQFQLRNNDVFDVLYRKI